MWYRASSVLLPLCTTHVTTVCLDFDLWIGEECLQTTCYVNCNILVKVENSRQEGKLLHLTTSTGIVLAVLFDELL